MTSPEVSHLNTKSPTLEILLNSYFEDPAEGSGVPITYLADVEAEVINFNANNIVATVWRPALDVHQADNWEFEFDSNRRVRMRIFIRGVIQTFKFDGMVVSNVRIDMLADGELRPIIGDKLAHPVDEKTILRLVSDNPEFATT